MPMALIPYRLGNSPNVAAASPTSRLPSGITPVVDR